MDGLKYSVGTFLNLQGWELQLISLAIIYK